MVAVQKGSLLQDDILICTAIDDDRTMWRSILNGNASVAYVVTGAHHPRINGVYTRTNDTCHGHPVFRSQSGHDLFRPNGQGTTTSWMVGRSHGNCAYSGILSSPGQCSASPDQTGCVGLWWEYDVTGCANPTITATAPQGWCPNPKIEISAVLSSLVGLAYFASADGPCTVTGRCAQRLHYDNNEACTIVVGTGGTIGACPKFDTESDYDILTIDGQDFSGSSCPEGVEVAPNSTITWQSDGSVTHSGWKICF